MFILLTLNWQTCKMKHYRRCSKRLMHHHQIGLTWRINRLLRDFRRPFWTCWGRCVSCSILRIRSTSLVSWDAWRSWGRSATTMRRCSHPGESTTTNLPRCSVRSGTCSDTQEVKDEHFNLRDKVMVQPQCVFIWMMWWSGVESPHDLTSGWVTCWVYVINVCLFCWCSFFFLWLKESSRLYYVILELCLIVGTFEITCRTSWSPTVINQTRTKHWKWFTATMVLVGRAEV